MSDADARIAALEAQVARLSALVGRAERRADHRGAADGEPVDRRTMLRRGGLALAGLAGAAAVPTVLSGAAAADTGDPVLAGATTSASAGDVTVLTANNPDEPVLQLTNTAPIGTGEVAHPVLRLTPSAGLVDSATGDAGDLTVSDLSVDAGAGFGGTFLNYAHTGATTGDPDQVFWGNVYTSQFASFIEFLSTPIRVLDTRNATGIGSTSKRPAFSTTTVNLGFEGANAQELVISGLGVIGNVTVVAPEGGAGRLTLWPGDGPPPNASSINFTTGQTLANFQMVGLFNDSFKIYTVKTTHILFDVVGFIVPDVGLVGPFDISEASAMAQSTRLAAARESTARTRRWRR